MLYLKNQDHRHDVVINVRGFLIRFRPKVSHYLMQTNSVKHKLIITAEAQAL